MLVKCLFKRGITEVQTHVGVEFKMRLNKRMVYKNATGGDYWIAIGIMLNVVGDNE